MTALPAQTRATPPPEQVRARLIRLRRPVPQAAGPSRRLTADDPRMILSAVLTEIDETVLPRRIDLRRPDGTGLRLDVAGRRVLALPGGDGPLPDAPDAAARIVARALAAHLGTARTISLVVRRLGGTPVTATGCSVAHLALALGLPASADPDEDIGTALARALDDLAIGWVRLASPGQIAAQGGAAGTARDLATLSLQMAQDLDPLLGAALGGRRVAGWLYLDGAGADGLVVARSGDRVTLARVAARLWPELQARLTTLFGES